MKIYRVVKDGAIQADYIDLRYADSLARRIKGIVWTGESPEPLGDSVVAWSFEGPELVADYS
jgi:hypothetical protein